MFRLFFAAMCICIVSSYNAMSCIDYGFDEKQTAIIKEKCNALHAITLEAKDKCKSTKELKRFLDVSNDKIKTIIKTDDVYVYEYLKKCVNFTRNNLE